MSSFFGGLMQRWSLCFIWQFTPLCLVILAHCKDESHDIVLVYGIKMMQPDNNTVNGWIIDNLCQGTEIWDIEGLGEKDRKRKRLREDKDRGDRRRERERVSHFHFIYKRRWPLFKVFFQVLCAVLKNAMKCLISTWQMCFEYRIALLMISYTTK